MNNYETVFILTPVLSDDQVKEAVEKFKSLLIEEGSEIVNEEDWGLRKLAYPIDKKTTGFYAFLEFKAEPHVIEKLEVNFRRDERVIRFLTVKQDKFALEYAEKRRNKGKKKQETVTTSETVKPKRAEKPEVKAETSEVKAKKEEPPVEKPEVKAEKPEVQPEKVETKDETPKPKVEQVENPPVEAVSPEVKDETPEVKVEITETKVENPEPEAEGLETVEEEVELKEKED